MSPARPTCLALLGSCLGVVLLASEPERPAVAGDLSDEVVVLRRSRVGYERTTAIGPSQFGLLRECLVRVGDRVRADQVLGRLQDDDARAEVRLREKEAESDVEIRLGESKHAQALSKLARTANLLRRNAVSQEEYHLQRLETEAAALAVEAARHRQELALIQRDRSRLLLRGRELVSPHDGVVLAVQKQAGEPVAPNETVFRVVDLDRIEVIGKVDVADLWRLRDGQPVKIIPEIAGADLAIEREVFWGQVASIDPHVDPTTRTSTLVVRLVDPNHRLRAGLEVRMEIHPVTRTEDTPPRAAH